MLRLITIMISIGLADSLNPSTLAAAMYLATGDNARDEVLKFTAGVFCVYLTGGLLIALGPGRLLIRLIPTPGATLGAWLEVAAGASLIIASWYLITRRHKLREKQLPSFGAGSNGPAGAGDAADTAAKPSWRRSSFLLGAGIMLFELPTALPAFAAVAAIAAVNPGPLETVLLLVIFNVCFIVPLLAMVLVLALSGDRATERLLKLREQVEHHWPLVLGVVALIAGAFVIALGMTALGSKLPGRLGRFSKRFHHVLPK